MGIKQHKINVNELVIGMFVSGLDRPWSQTPFPLQGFYIRDADTIRQLKSLCQHVYIDRAKGPGPIAARLKSAPDSLSARVSAHKRQKPSAVPKAAPLSLIRDRYPPTHTLRKEAPRAYRLHQQVQQTVAEVMKQLSRGHLNQAPLEEAQRLASGMVQSLLRNPDAFTWLSRIQEKDQSTHSHAIRCAVWAIVFGRHLGLSRKNLDTLALGMLLKDVGKVKLERALLKKVDRTPEEEREYQRFVEQGVELLRQSGLEPRVISVVRTHCERFNGNGFPRGLHGDRIPLLGKIAGLVTVYDGIVHPRGHTHPLAPSKAAAHLYGLRDREFQQELVVEFIRAVGLYPTGTLIELNTGEVAVVMEQNFKQRLKPRVMLVLDERKHPLTNRRPLDLTKGRRSWLGRGGTLSIARDLEPSRYPLDLGTVREQYLRPKRRSLWRRFGQ